MGNVESQSSLQQEAHDLIDDPYQYPKHMMSLIHPKLTHLVLPRLLSASRLTVPAQFITFCWEIASDHMNLVLVDPS